MTQHVLTTATSPPPRRPRDARRGRAARAAPARRSARPCSRGTGRRSSPSSGMRLLTHVQVRSPAAVLDAALDAVALERRVVGDEIAGRDHARRRAAAPTARAPPRQRCSRRARSRLGQLVLAQVGLADVDRDAVVGRVRARSPRPPAGRSRGPGPGRSRAWRPRSRARPSRSRRRARCRAPRLEQLEAELRRRVPARAEGAARVDHDRDRVSVRLLPGRADPEPADPDGLVELPPAVGPVLLDLGRGRAAERLPDPLLAGRVRVGRELEPASAASISSKPSGKSSSMTARASSARPGGR